MKILVIDDEKHIRQSLADYLEDNDYYEHAQYGRPGLVGKNFIS
ncbi:hypothetical protein [Desulfobacter sp.]